ncbi:MAG: hypothetical protein LC109_04180 [Bacteroidia bacterium]|nr:hypothetical protein [Bacteroidia bacterium]
MKKLFLIVGMILFVCLSCNKEKREETPNVSDQNVVLILNEGNFGWGNADFGFYNIETHQYSDKVFETVNNRPLGDVLQSGIIHDDEIYLVLNNSGTIEVVDKETFKHKRTISNLGSPRYLALIENTDEAFLTDTYSNKVIRLNLKTGEILTTIPVYGWQDKVVSMKGQFFAVQSLLSKKVYLISAKNNEVVDSLEFSGDMGKLQGYDGKAYLLDKGSKSIIWEINENGERLEYLNGAGEIDLFEITSQGCYFLSKGKLNLFSTSGLNVIAEIPSTGKYYAMSFNSNSKQLFISDARDYVRKGKVYVIHESGKINDEIEAGVIPNGFLAK